jgi:hypothetical protein
MALLLVGVVAVGLAVSGVVIAALRQFNSRPPQVMEDRWYMEQCRQLKALDR